MRALKTLLVLTLPALAQQATLYEGARLVTGDSAAPIESSAFLVENGKFTRVGKKGDIKAPAGAARVDLTGKTVMPAIIDAHTHLGWAIIKTGQINKDTYSKANLEDHLRRLAYYGIAATQNFGTDPGDIAFQVRAEILPGMAIFRTAGGGMGMPSAGPGAE